ncbi:hypothetical protein [Sinimarinibacterium sp. NLF-5-8]|uniref:hypothetical protein n=1 Tax=Sinimarinibacterium sp. NLF-5-8 TaxID=2698684 RepID=UPI00137BC95C|nr:hypothetical protein [Sinimarinibacterium sp. NLF-5-8]QHS09171.1 hypothetical protein GT972_02695 [Sinimarinibacterium sp. NLF-5-8]
MNIKIDADRHLDIATPFARARASVSDVAAVMRRFPKIRDFQAQGGDVYLARMEPISSQRANISHEVSFAGAYSADAEQGVLQWRAVKGKGNAQLNGRLQLIDLGARGTQLRLSVTGELQDVPVPLLFRPVAGTFIQAKFGALIDGFLEATGDALA